MLFHLIVGSAALAVLLSLPVGRAMVALAILAVLWLVRIAMVLLTVALLGAIIGTLIWVSLRALVGPLSQLPAPVNAGLVVAVMLAAFWWLDVRARKKQGAEVISPVEAEFLPSPPPPPALQPARKAPEAAPARIEPYL